MAVVFPAVRRDPIEPVNTLPIAGNGPISAARLLRSRSLPPLLRPLGVQVADQLAPRLPGTDVYTDDRAPVEWLVDQSILGYANSQ